MKILAISDVYKGSQVVSELMKTTGRSLPSALTLINLQARSG